jgi:serine/threonine protein kinase
MSVVYRADNIRLGNKIALKVLTPELSEDDAFRERFVRESRVAASINHPNIIPIYDAGDSDGLLYIVMRYVDSGDLKSLLRREGPLPVARACALVSQVGGALHAAHESGLIHRDIKPGNILVERIDDGIEVLEHVYLADFGLTKHAQSRSGLTHTGQFVGTVDYVAPEQIEGRPVDKRADVYSLGCVLFECLTGVVPYHRESDVAVLWAHVQEPCPPVGTLRSDLPPGMDEVVARAMAKSPDDRYQTASAFVADLGQVAREDVSGAVRGVTSTASASSMSRPTEPARPADPPAPIPMEPETAVGSDRDDDHSQMRIPGRAKRSVQGVVAALVVVALLTAVGLYALSRGGTHTTSPPATGPHTTPPTPSGFPNGTGGLQLVMDHRLLGNHQCRDTRVPMAGLPATTGANAVEGVTCQANVFPTVQYAVFLYPDTNTLQAAFNAVLQDWASTGHWHRSGNACHASGVWSGGPVIWRHPSDNPPAPGHLGGYRACYHSQPTTLMVWIHLRNNGTQQPDHYDTLVAAASTNTGPGESLPSDLRNFWQFNRKTVLAPIGKSLTGQNLPPLSSFPRS